MVEPSESRKTIKLGLTGSLGMGKSTVAKLFLSEEIPVWNADDTVEKLYKKDQEGYEIVKRIMPKAVNKDQVDKVALSKLIIKQEKLLIKLESEIHPLLKLERDQFIKQFSKEKLLVFEIPLLYETNAQKWLDSVLVVTAPKVVQKSRVMKRSFMSEKKFDFLLSRQISNEKKISMADYVINTNKKIPILKQDVKRLIVTLRKEN